MVVMSTEIGTLAEIESKMTERSVSGGRSSGHRRANETVPTTSRRTETKLASSAPPDIDTIIVAAADVSPSEETWTA
jgi:hypothetical protein